MIRFLQKQKAKKGFTIVELIVVIAIMAVLMAVILPQIMTKKSVIDSANSTARDFYAAMQTVMTKYSLYEGPLSPAYQADLNLGEMRYFENMNGNYPFKKGSTSLNEPATTSLYVELETENNEITKVYTYAIEGSDSGYTNGAGLFQLCNRDSANLNTEFGKLLKAELAGRINYRDGYYYAKVEYEKKTTLTIPAKMEAETVKVKYTGYCEKSLPGRSNLTEFRNKTARFDDDYVLVTGRIFGVCAPYNATTKSVLGYEGTYLA